MVTYNDKSKNNILKKFSYDVKVGIIKYYIKNNFNVISNIEDDLSIVKSIKLSITRRSNGKLKHHKVLLNNIITLYNIFGVKYSYIILKNEIKEELHYILDTYLYHLGLICDKNLINLDQELLQEL